MRVILTAFLILAFATAAQAAATLSTAPVPIAPLAITSPAPFGDPVLGTSACWDLQVTTTGDLLGMQILSVSGTLYNHVVNDPPAANSDLPPNPFLLPAYPALAYDSYVNLPTTTILPVPGTITILAGTLGTTTAPSVLPMDYVDVTNDGPQTNFVVARLTLTSGGPLLPSFTQTVTPGAPLVVNVQEDVGGTPVITTWYNVPEPATMSLLALGGLAVLRRRR